VNHKIQLAVDYDSDKSTICPFFYYSENARTAYLPKPNRWKINKFNACMLNVGSLATVVQYLVCCKSIGYGGVWGSGFGWIHV
jgi:hypothetical protein